MSHGTERESGAPVKAYLALAVLFFAYTLSFIDRTILALLVEPIQRDLGIGDTGLSLLHGFAFALFYTFLGIPIARLADRRSRRVIISVGIAVWSLATALCGLARNFVQLFSARVLVGVGEAALSPAAYSLITDLFPRKRLGTALGIYQIGLYVGSGLAFIIGGFVIGVAARADVSQLPLVGELRSWQLVFMIVGLPGLLVALVTLALPEPRTTASALVQDRSPKVSIRSAFSFLRLNWRVYGGHFLGFSFVGLVFNGYMAWLPTFFIRRFSWSQIETGQWLGMAILVFGSLGILSGGLLADRLQARGRNDAAIMSGLVGAIGMFPFAITAPLLADPFMSLFALCGFFFFSSFPYAGAVTAIQIVSPSAIRAQTSAIFLFFLNLLGIGFGPTVVALITDFVVRDQASIHTSLVITAVLALPVGIGLLSMTLKPYSLLTQKSAEEVFST